MVEVQLATLAAEAREAIDSEDLARAADACRRALLRFPRWVEGYWLLGHILVESGYVPQARSCFEAVASAMPDDARAYQGLADAAEQQHDVATAVAGLLRALEVGEDNQSVLEELRRLQQQAGYVDENIYTNARVAHARLVAGQYEEADVAAERALQDEPERLDLLVVQAVARLFGGDRGGSEKVCRQLLDLSPDCLKALAILRYLVPGEETTAMIAELDALDPEGQTLVWLRGQMTTLGYDADDLPSAPRLVAWQDDEQPGRDGERAVRPLDRLIPELEEVWPQWLQQAAQATPEVRTGGPPAQSEEAPPPPTFEQEEAQPATPSFLGDVDTLAREFEDAMRPAPVQEPPAAAKAVAEIPVEEPAVGEAVAVAEPVDWHTPQPNEQAPIDEADTPVAAETPEEQPATPPTKPTDEFAQWQTPAEPATVSPSPDAFDQPGVDASKPGEAEAVRSAVVPPVLRDEEDIDIDALALAAQAAIAAGNHWSAINQYGAILARVRAMSDGRR